LFSINLVEFEIENVKSPDAAIILAVFWDFNFTHRSTTTHPINILAVFLEIQSSWHGSCW
jgi:hypothetical protein